MPKWVIAFIILLISFVAYVDLKKLGLVNSIEIRQLSLPKINTKEFANHSECNDYIVKNSGNSNKLEVGKILCLMQFGNSNYISTEESRKLSKCIIEDFKSIQDDASGTRVVTECNEKFQLKEVGFLMLAEFSESKRIERANESMLMQSKIENIKNRIQIEDQNILNHVLGSSRNDGPLIINDGGIMKSCIKIGPIIDCP